VRGEEAGRTTGEAGRRPVHCYSCGVPCVE